MNDHYRICIIAPPGYAHSACFREVAFLLKSALTSLGITCDLSVNELAADRINVLLGAHLIPFEDRYKSYQYIPYQLEQLSDIHPLWNDTVRLFLKHAFKIWDYSKDNIRFLASHGFVAEHLPLGYHDALQLVPHSNPKDIDVLFFGSVGAKEGRRYKLLEKLSQRSDIKSMVLFGKYGPQRDELIGRASIILNIHHYDAMIFEAVRVSYLLNNDCFVLSEISADYPYVGVDIPQVAYEEIIGQCTYFIEHQPEREDMRRAMALQFKNNYLMVDLIARVI